MVCVRVGLYAYRLTIHGKLLNKNHMHSPADSSTLRAVMCYNNSFSFR